MFPGQGAQYVDMGRDLYLSEPTFRARIDYCSELLEPLLGTDLRPVLYPDGAYLEEAENLLKQTSITQPSLFATEYALAELYMEWGIRPRAMIGHSIGEYVAACLSGVFSLDDALALVAERGRLMQQMPAGSMLAVPLAETELKEVIDEGVSIAAVNAPSLCVVSGATDDMRRFESALEQRGVECRNLKTSHAFHSAMMEPAVAEFVEFMSGIESRAPQIPFLSNLTGSWISDAEATDPEYWAAHLRHAVLFSKGIQCFLDDPDRVLVEVGPGNTLCSLAMKHAGRAKDQLVIKSMRHPQEQQADLQVLLTTLGRLWTAGVYIDWQGFYRRERRRRIPLPTYPFDQKSYWIDSPQGQDLAAPPGRVQARAPQTNRDISEWFYTASWKRTDLLSDGFGKGECESGARYLVFRNDEFGAALAARIADGGGKVVAVLPGSSFEATGPASYSLNPAYAGDYALLFESLLSRDLVPDHVLQLWSLGEDGGSRSSEEIFNKAQALGYYPLLYLAQALLGQHTSHPIRITVVTEDLHDVSGAENLRPENAPLFALCKVIPQEQGNISCQTLDITKATPQDLVLKNVLAELGSGLGERTIAYRGRHRWTQIFDPVALSGQPGLKEKGVYLITGGLGRVGIILAKGLARDYRARIAFVSRSWIPDRDDWDDWRATAPAMDEETKKAIDRKIAAMREIESLGGEVLALGADVSDPEQLEGAISGACERFGRLDGVIHAAHGGGSFLLIGDATREDAESRFKPKVLGTYALANALGDRDLDFCVLLSSNASILGGLTLASYAAANQFLDSFAQDRNRTSRFPWISTNWDRWLPEELANEGQTRSIDIFAITPEEGFEAFKRITSQNALSQVIVSRGPIGPRIDQWINAVGSGAAADESAPADTDVEEQAVEAVTPAGGSEIEAVLQQHESIRDCAVLTYDDSHGSKNITAYFVSDTSVSTLSLRNFLRKKLPHYMIPAVLTKLDEIPVTSNGKTDYKTLASYNRGSKVGDTQYVSPETPAEKTIAAIWESLLGIGQIEVGDNFFDIGGDSFLIIQAISAIEKETGVSIPVKDFFYQTLGQIAAYCEGNRRAT
jgi:acyl transferase domain-containing protein/acyl carrier protein